MHLLKKNRLMTDVRLPDVMKFCKISSKFKFGFKKKFTLKARQGVSNASAAFPFADLKPIYKAAENVAAALGG